MTKLTKTRSSVTVNDNAEKGTVSPSLNNKLALKGGEVQSLFFQEKKKVVGISKRTRG